MIFSKFKEYLFDHPSGSFTGFVQAESTGWIVVLLTSSSMGFTKVKESEYEVGDERNIRSSTPAVQTQRRRTHAEYERSMRHIKQIA
jgi:hypothetical protein